MSGQSEEDKVKNQEYAAAAKALQAGNYSRGPSIAYAGDGQGGLVEMQYESGTWKLTQEAAQSLESRTQNAIGQLTRYGKQLENEELVSLLELLTDLNDDIANGRTSKNIRDIIFAMRDELTKLEANLKD